MRHSFSSETEELKYWMNNWQQNSYGTFGWPRNKYLQKKIIDYKDVSPDLTAEL